MTRSRSLLGLAGALMLSAAPALAQEPVKVGFVTVLSGPQATLGQQMRDGFMLGLKQLGNKLGGRPVEVVVVDDELKPDVAVTKVRALLERDKVDFVVGPVFSNIAMAIYKPVVDSDTIMISPNPGPAPLAGKACSQNFFSTAYQNDMPHMAAGAFATQKGIKKLYLLAPNYQAGKDALAGVKAGYKGEVVDEVYTPLGQLDFAAELAKIAEAKPDGIYVFLPGGMGVNFVKQFRQAGLADKITFISAFTVDESTLPAQQDAALGFFSGTTWAPGMDNPQNKKFVDAYVAEFNAVPATYAAHAYDTANLLDSALKATGGNTKDKAALRAAIRKADFVSVRGAFKFNTNGFPIQDYYAAKVVKRPDGKFQTEVAAKVLEAKADPYVGECGLK